MTNSLPSISRIWPPDHSTRTHSSPVMVSPSPSTRLASTAQSRSTPSWWLEEVRSFIGQSGQVSALSSFSGGLGMISSWVTLFAPCRFEVPTQSLPVSPPPITTTCLPVAVRLPRGAARSSSSPATRLFCWVRNSIAIRTPGISAPGIASGRASSAPPARTTASKFSRSEAKEISTPTSLEVLNVTPSASICTQRRLMRCFSILKSGMP